MKVDLGFELHLLTMKVFLWMPNNFTLSRRPLRHHFFFSTNVVDNVTLLTSHSYLFSFQFLSPSLYQLCQGPKHITKINFRIKNKKIVANKHDSHRNNKKNH